MPCPLRYHFSNTAFARPITPGIGSSTGVQDITADSPLDESGSFESSEVPKDAGIDEGESLSHSQECDAEPLTPLFLTVPEPPECEPGPPLEEHHQLEAECKSTLQLESNLEDPKLESGIAETQYPCSSGELLSSDQRVKIESHSEEEEKNKDLALLDTDIKEKAITGQPPTITVNVEIKFHLKDKKDKKRKKSSAEL